MIRLPISGARAQWRSATGHDDMALADSRPGLAGVLDYVARSVSTTPAARRWTRTPFR